MIEVQHKLASLLASDDSKIGAGIRPWIIQSPFLSAA